MLSITQDQLMGWLSPVLWPFLRVLAVMSSTPILSSRAFPARARVGFAFLVALALQASLPLQPVIDVGSSAALGAVLQQVGLGLAIGVAIRVVLSAVELAGEVIGFQMGLNFAAFFDPSLNSQSSAVARFLGQMSLYLFVVLNGPVLVLLAVQRSFERYPVDQNFLDALQRMRLFDLGRDVFASGLWIALPLVGLLLFVNIALGIISRVAPQMNIFAIGFPITLVAGLVGLTFTLPMLDQPLMALIQRALDMF